MNMGGLGMSTQAALDTAATIELSKAGYSDFKERRWVPVFMFLVDVAAIEAALYFGYLARHALSIWWPIYLGPNTYQGLILGVLVVPVAYYLAGLHPG